MNERTMEATRLSWLSEHKTKRMLPGSSFPGREERTPSGRIARSRFLRRKPLLQNRIGKSMPGIPLIPLLARRSQRPVLLMMTAMLLSFVLWTANPTLISKP